MEDPDYREELERLRSVLDAWRDQYDVWGDVPEEQMVAQARWKPYKGPITLTQGTTMIRVKAVRIGYKDSEEVTASYVVEF